jgi:hypothetical protein
MNDGEVFNLCLLTLPNDFVFDVTLSWDIGLRLHSLDDSA